MIKSVLSYLVLVFAGVLVATVGASSHRAIPMFGIALSLLLVLAGAVFARAWKTWAGVSVFAAAWVGMTVLYSAEGPGGSVLIASDQLGWVWTIGGAVAIVIAALIPTRLLMGDDDVAL